MRGPSPDDDYLTWAPAPARIRQVPTGPAADKHVIVTNDPEGPVPAGRKHPLDGNVAFAKSVQPGTTATEPTLDLTLPADGSWVQFVVAGSFPRASTEDKDAIIEVHENTADGPVLYKHAVMVRIRKNQGELTDSERSRFLDALSKLHRVVKGYERFVRVHELASMGKYQHAPDYFWPDLAHRGPGFLAWHRAYLLSFERELQKIDPSVALPYWKMDLLPSVFEEKFVGANVVSTDAFVEPTFAAGNPLAHWVVNGVPLYRFPNERRDAQELKATFFSDDKLFMPSGYFLFGRQLEGNPHNLGHNWTGVWMQNCMISPSDPVFWPFHTGFDRQWARWEWLGAHIQPDGSNESYSPNDAYSDAAPGCDISTPNMCQPIGHHLKDTMWPWNSAVGPGAKIKGNRPPADLSQDYIGPFAVAPIAGLWPSQPATPTPGDMIDYAGVTPQRLDMGFAYDDVRFGVQPPVAVAMNNAPDTSAFLASTPAAIAVASDSKQSEAKRIEALRKLGPSQDTGVAPVAIGILDEPGRSTALATAAIDALSLQMMFGELDPAEHHAVLAAFHKALSDQDVAVRQAALRVLVSHRDPTLIAKLAASLDDEKSGTFSPVDAITGLAVAGAIREQAPRIRKLIHAGDVKARAAAIVALASDPASRSTITSIAGDASQPEEVRSAAIRSLAAGGADAIPVLLDVVGNTKETRTLRDQAASALAVTIESAGKRLDKDQVESVATKLRNVDSGIARNALKATNALRETK